MPPKSSSKKDQFSWLLCEKCKIYITSKDRSKHEEDCPIPNEITEYTPWKYSFVRSKQIHAQQLCEATGQTAILTDELLSDLGTKYLSNLVFVSESVMNLCDWIISDFVVLQPTCDNHIPVVKRVWPAVDKNTSNVFVTDEGEFILLTT